MPHTGWVIKTYLNVLITSEEGGASLNLISLYDSVTTWGMKIATFATLVIGLHECTFSLQCSQSSFPWIHKKPTLLFTFTSLKLTMRYLILFKFIRLLL